MSLSTSPRKVIPLASGDDWPTTRSHSSGPSLTKRVFFAGVVVESMESGRGHSQDVQDLVMSLGKHITSRSGNSLLGSPSELSIDEEASGPTQRKRAMTDSTALTDVINELVSTERSYVKRLQTLKHDYADPLRKFSRSKDTAILPSYEAKILFGNIDNLLPVNEAFLVDLEKMVAPNANFGVGDVAIRHFRDIRGFEHYKHYYIKREEAQAIFERERAKKSSGFAAFIDRIKYSSSDTRNRVGLRELLMDPVQRIPRYTLMFRTMIKYMAPDDPQRAKLVEADEIASKIALAETDEQTTRAATMYCLSATVDGFPPGLISNSRRFIDCIDVEDILSDAPSSSSGGSNPSHSLHCTLFLFDDKLMIVKRPGNGEKSGRTLSGLDELQKLAKTGGLPLGMKKSGMVVKGVVDITDVVATDVGGPDIHIYLETSPMDQTDRWSGRPFRSLSVVLPPSPINLDPLRTDSEKQRFLENLWNAQAVYRTKSGQSVGLVADECEVESRGGRTTIARTYFNVYQRTAFLQESKKTKIVVHIDTLGSADPIPFGLNSPPFVIIRVQPMAGELSRYTVTSSDASDEGEEDIVQTARIPARIIQTIHQFGLFKFKTGKNSLPSTPTASTRSRAAIFSLDAISRNLFNALPGSSKGDFLGGSISHRRTKSTTSRSSMYTQTTSTTDESAMKFSLRSNSTATQATTVSTIDDDDFVAERSPSRSRKRVQRGKSPGGSGSESERTSPSRHQSRSSSLSREVSREDVFYDDTEDDDGTIMQHMGNLDQSELDLTKRLELARQNSQNQHGKQNITALSEVLLEETIYEEEPPQPVRPASRISRHTASRLAISQSDCGSSLSSSDSAPFRSRSASRHSLDRHPIGPRSPSPLPSISPRLSPSKTDLPSMDEDLARERHVLNVIERAASPAQVNDVASPLPRSKRQPFVPKGNTETTPRPATVGPGQPSTVEPLSIKKKTSVRSSHGTPTPVRRTHSRNSPMSKVTKVNSPRRVSPQVRSTWTAAPPISSTAKGDIAERLIVMVQSTREDIESSHRSVKRIKLELENLRPISSRGDTDVTWKLSSPDKSLRSPMRGNTSMTKMAQERMQEMQQLIQKRQGDNASRSRPNSVMLTVARSQSLDEIGDNGHVVDELVADASRHLEQAVSKHISLQKDFQNLSSHLQDKSSELDRTKVELQNSKRQCELVKSLLADATAEKEIMYEAFNEELDGMYNDANLPEDEAWVAMTNDLRQAKETRNSLSKENSQLKRRLAEAETQKEEWGALLRAHGLIP